MRKTRPISLSNRGHLELLVLLLSSLTPMARAQVTSTWTGAGPNSLWSNAANWDANGVPGSGMTTGLDFTGSAATSNNDLGTFSLNIMQFDVAADLTVSGNDLNFMANSANPNNPIDPVLNQNSAFQITIANNITLTGNLTVNLAKSGTVNLTGLISGAGSLTIAGQNTNYLALLSHNGNTYTGGTVIAGGTLQLGADHALPDNNDVLLSGAVTTPNVTPDAVLDLNGHNVVVRTITFGGGVDGPLNTNNTRIVDTSAGSTGSLTLNGSIIFDGNPSQGSNGTPPALISSNVILAAGQHTMDTTSTGTFSNGYYDLILSGNISGPGGLNLGSPQDTSDNFPLNVVLSGNSSFTGVTNIYKGSIFAGAENAVSPQSTVAIGTAGKFYLYLPWDQTDGEVPPHYTLTVGSYNQTIGALSNLGTGVGGNIFLGAATLTVGANNASTKFTGTIQDSDSNLANPSYTGAGGSLVKTGTGTLTLGGGSSYTGTTTINAGTLQLGIDDALPPTTPLTLNGGAFDTNGYSQEVNAVTNNGGDVLIRGASGTVTVDGIYTQSTGITQVDTTLAITPGENLTLTGGQLVGTGTITNATASGTVTVTNSGGILRPGDLLPTVKVGTLTINGNYTQASNSSMEIDLGGTTPGVNYDVLKVTNNANLAGTLDVKLLGSFVPVVGETFNFLTYGGTLTDGLLPANVVALDPGYAYSASFANGTGTLKVTATGVPEASTLLTASLILGTGGLLLRRQRRLQNVVLPPSA